jgi:ankyrin repeat protein
MRRFHLKNVAQLIVASVVSGSAIAGAYDDFFRAVGVDDARTVAALLARGFDPNSVSLEGQSGLFLALRSESASVAEALIAHPELRVDATNPHGETALMMAALRGQAAFVQRLIDRGGQVNREGWTPLHYAAAGPEAKVVALLLDRGAAIEAPSPNRTTPLMMAARYGSEASVEVLLRRGADVKARNALDLTAGDFARQAGREALARRLDALAR